MPPKEESKKSVVTDDHMKRIKELQSELSNPPKNPLIGLKTWRKVREDEIKQLLTQ